MYKPISTVKRIQTAMLGVWPWDMEIDYEDGSFYPIVTTES